MMTRKPIPQDLVLFVALFIRGLIQDYPSSLGEQSENRCFRPAPRYPRGTRRSQTGRNLVAGPGVS